MPGARAGQTTDARSGSWLANWPPARPTERKVFVLLCLFFNINWIFLSFFLFSGDTTLISLFDLQLCIFFFNILIGV